MKLKKRSIGFLLLSILIVFSFSSQLISNAQEGSKSNGYILPKESSSLTFKVTKMNKNGKHWLYAEDENYYYSLVLKDLVIDNSYIKMSKQEASKIDYFDKHDFRTWKYDFLCGDLLERFGEKPDKLEFVECKSVNAPQTIIEAKYRVRGKNSKEVEDFLIEKYGMGELKWVCCGWENNRGKSGSFNHDKFTAIHPYLGGGISMYASGEVEDELEFDRNKIEYFTVKVRLSIV